ncbi:MOB kinase activator-like 1A isoform X2 [Actinidia eriantha]|uniref:MOB kinase activator-like 1A isoform X2 n=1 Tax=Actinidia eriantha TaxID=165200 RepID=UPI00258CA2ED|nr:MOB kinase activator-like 1A isoform X2 [Actinidia eriantha]
MACCQHCGLFQPGEFASWYPHGVLHSRKLSYNDSRTQIFLCLIGATNPWFIFQSSYPIPIAKYEYRWADGVQIKKPIEVSAPKYVEYLMDWIETQLDDESIFPQRIGAPFPPNFREVVKTIFKRLFRVYAHIYHSHFQKIVSLKEEAHLNTCFKHFILFTCEFGLIDKKELAPLQELIESVVVPY